MSYSIFISYRRTDSQHAAFAIFDRLKWAFGEDEVFLDRSANQSGDDWRAQVLDSVTKARVVLAIIGPNWLRSAHKDGRRRIDDPNDWVRIELCRALETNNDTAKRTIIPVLVEGAEHLEPDALDAELQALARPGSHVIPNDHWELELNALVDQLYFKFLALPEAS